MLSLSESDRRSLLQWARQVVTESVSRGQLPEKILSDGVFAKRCGVFVTLRSGHRLRGCIGVIEAEEPLGESIARSAASAALQDPRFAPLGAGDLAGLGIEISLLSSPAPIDPEQIEIGCHGLLISRGTHRGLLLPQVAVEHHLDRQQFLEETCRKAQLARDAWKDPGTKILAFTCEILSEASDAHA
jgi:AmmeMemoRadiSam system protein A